LHHIQTYSISVSTGLRPFIVPVVLLPNHNFRPLNELLTFYPFWYNLVMPAINETSIELRKSQAIQVYILVLQGSKLVDALEEVGMTKNAYYRWIQSCDDALEALHELNSSLEREVLSDMIIAKRTIINNLIKKVDSGTLDAKEFMDIYRLFDMEISALTSKHTVAVQDVIDFLSGPETRTIAQGANVSVKDDGSIDIKPIIPDVVDV